MGWLAKIFGRARPTVAIHDSYLPKSAPAATPRGATVTKPNLGVRREPPPKPAPVKAAPSAQKQEPVAVEEDGPDEVFIRGTGDFSIDVVGESHYQQALERAAGGRSESGVDVVVKATLVLEDSNPHDDQAVAVRLDGATVGYLDRYKARAFRQIIATWNVPPDYPLRCMAKITGGWDRGNGDRGSFGIRLDWTG